MRIPKSKLYVTYLSSQQTVVLDSPSSLEFMVVNDDFENLVEKLCHIQRKTGVRLRLGKMALDAETVKLIEETYAAVSAGKAELANVDLTLKLSKQSVEVALKAKHLGLDMTYSTMEAESRVTILNTDIPLGPASWNISAAIPKLSVEELQTILDNMAQGDYRPIPLQVLRANVEYINWL